MIKCLDITCLITLLFGLLLPAQSFAAVKLEMQGASYTTGWGSRLPFPIRIKHHWQENDQVRIDQLADKKIFVGFDYFFPSNFTDLSKDPSIVRKKVETLVSGWSASHDLVLVGLLPDRVRLSEYAKVFLQKDSRALDNIIRFLESDAYKRGRNEVNKVLRERASFASKLVLVSLDPLIEDFASYKYREKDFFYEDNFHPVDTGQALIYNSLLLPLLRQHLNLELTPMPLVSVSDSSFERIIGNITGTKADFEQKKPGIYWAHLSDTRQTSPMAANIKIPLSYFKNPREVQNQYSQLLDNGAIVIHGNDFSLAKKLEKLMKKGERSKGFRELYGISRLIEKGPHTGFFVYLSQGEQGVQISLDLSQILYYNIIDLKAVSENVYEFWGYDYWISYIAPYFMDWQLSWMVTPIPSNIPSTNYHATLTRDKYDATKFKIDWMVLPTVEISKGSKKVQQPDSHEARLPYIPDPWFKEVRENSGEYVSLNYKIEIEITPPTSHP